LKTLPITHQHLSRWWSVARNDATVFTKQTD